MRIVEKRKKNLSARFSGMEIPTEKSAPFQTSKVYRFVKGTRRKKSVIAGGRCGGGAAATGNDERRKKPLRVAVSSLRETST